ncbi:MAG: sulfite exporter TauE/SafE family protein [Halobacteriota archaeon]
MDPLILLIIFFVSLFVGVITSMLGVGEGLLLVPFLTLAAGIPIQTAIATSLVSSIANSSAASMTYAKDRRLNLRLALWFAITATIGAIIGAQIAAQIDRMLLNEVFAAALVVAAALMFLRRKEVDAESTDLHESHRDRLQLDGSYKNAVLERTLSYRVKRPLLGLLSGFAAGNASGLLGIGGGIINVPIMTLGMRVPIKVATGTSAFIIGLTTAVGAIIYYSNGFVQPLLAAIVVEAVFVGATVGPRIQGKIRNDALAAIFAVVLIVLASLMVLKGQS